MVISFCIFRLCSFEFASFPNFSVDSASQNLRPAPTLEKRQFQLETYTGKKRETLKAIVLQLGGVNKCFHCSVPVEPALLYDGGNIPEFSAEPKDYYLEPYHHVVCYILFFIRLSSLWLC
jgi:hypothetical protein